MSRRNNRQKVEEKPVDYLDELVNTSITQQTKKQKATLEVVEESIPDPIPEPVEDKSYNVKVMYPALRIRQAPSTQAEVIGIIADEGIYKIIDEVNGFGKIDENKWIMLSYTKII